MKLRIGSKIGEYTLTSDLTATANARIASAERGSRKFFVKEFQRPKYPISSLPDGHIKEEIMANCRAFESHHQRFIAKLRSIALDGGAIVLPVDFFSQGVCFYQVAPFIETHSREVKDVAALPIPGRLMFMHQLCKAIDTLHRNAIVHGDLKPPNVMLIRTAGGLIAPKIIDFDGSYFSGEPPHPDWMAFDQSYFAPEVVTYHREEGGAEAAIRLGTAADIFSLGILMHVYWTRGLPLIDGKYGSMAEAVLNGVMPRLTARDMPPKFMALLLDMLRRDPAARPSIEQVIEEIAKLRALLDDRAYVPSPRPEMAAPGPRPDASGSHSDSPGPDIDVVIGRRPKRATTGGADISVVTSGTRKRTVEEPRVVAKPAPAERSPPPRPAVLGPSDGVKSSAARRSETDAGSDGPVIKGRLASRASLSAKTD